LRDQQERAVTCDLDSPVRFGRASVLTRVLIVVFFVVPATLNWAVLLVLLPGATAVYLAARNRKAFEPGEAERLRAWLAWSGSLYAYAGFLTDRLGLDESDHVVEFTFQHPTRRPRSALTRTITAFASGIAFALLALASLAVWLSSAVAILIAGRYPGVLKRFQIRVLCYQTWLIAYQANVVSAYPRFSERRL
jgi:hypothetical protein